MSRLQSNQIECIQQDYLQYFLLQKRMVLFVHHQSTAESEGRECTVYVVPVELVAALVVADPREQHGRRTPELALQTAAGDPLASF
jgi:hypothetical protein